MSVSIDRESVAGVLLVTEIPVPHTGGASTHVLTLASQLRAHGVFEGLLSGFDVRGGFLERAVRAAVHRLSPSRGLIRTTEIRVSRLERLICERVRSKDVVVVHAHDILAACAAARAQRDGREFPIVLTIHGPWSREILASGRPSSHRYVEYAREREREALSAATRIIAVDRGQADILLSDFGVPENKITVVENCVDVDAVREESAEEYPVKHPDCTFVVPRRLVPKNGVEYAIRALAEPKAERARLLVAGDGALQRSLEVLARELGIEDRVTFLGPVPRQQLLRVMRSSKGVIVPSVPACGVIEATSLAVLEGMAVGVPVIGSDIGGIADILQSSEYGFLVPSGQPEALAAAIGDVIEMAPDALRALTDRAGKRVRERYGIDQWFSTVWGIYDTAAETIARK